MGLRKVRWFPRIVTVLPNLSFTEVTKNKVLNLGDIFTVSVQNVTVKHLTSPPDNFG